MKASRKPPPSSIDIVRSVIRHSGTAKGEDLIAMLIGPFEFTTRQEIRLNSMGSRCSAELAWIEHRWRGYGTR